MGNSLYSRVTLFLIKDESRYPLISATLSLAFLGLGLMEANELEGAAIPGQDLGNI
ncbi:hypothetical protein [Acaryochloris marina]|uniref:hypothetical protein n=1 Tax=Acaryochloris marina TaxID=155978 RepID=UPI0021C2F2AD|nr:hypothetical protein [Acaryochloris marina]